MGQMARIEVGGVLGTGHQRHFGFVQKLFPLVGVDPAFRVYSQDDPGFPEQLDGVVGRYSDAHLERHV